MRRCLRWLHARSPTGATRTHLIDNCGRIVNQWDSEFRAGESAYLLDDGSLLRACRQSSTVFTGGGMGSRIERFSWEGDLIWSYTLANDTACTTTTTWRGCPTATCSSWRGEYAPRKSRRCGPARGRRPPLAPDDPGGGAGGRQRRGGGLGMARLGPPHPKRQPGPAELREPLRSPAAGSTSTTATSLAAESVSPGSRAAGTGSTAMRWPTTPGSTKSSSTRGTGTSSTSSTTARPPKKPPEAGDLLYRWGNPEAYGRGLDADRQLLPAARSALAVRRRPNHGRQRPIDITVLLYNNGNNRPSGNAKHRR